MRYINRSGEGYGYYGDGRRDEDVTTAHLVAVGRVSQGLDGTYLGSSWTAQGCQSPDAGVKMILGTHCWRDKMQLTVKRFRKTRYNTG